VFVALVATAVHRAYPWILPAKPATRVTAATEPAPASGTEASGALTTA
jgi:hypothetical protein